MNLKRTILFLATGGAAIGLIGAGVGATFTDSATATENISVGTFGIALSTTTVGAVVVDSHHVTFTCPTILSSAPGSCPLSFTVTSTGSIPATVTVSSVVTGDSSFTNSMVGGGTPVLLSSPHTYSGGLQWTNPLTNADLGQSASITYTISATG